MSDAPPNAPEGGASAAQGATDIQPGALIGGTYRIEKRLGVGGLGPLYRAVDERSDAMVALRALAPELTGHPEVAASLRSQVELATTLQHKNIVKTFGIAAEKDLLFVITEHVVGQSLREIMDRKQRSNKPFTLKGAYNIVAHLCNACGYAHETSLHGALNPGNILVNKAGRIKIAEFGFARALSGLGNFESLLGGNGYLYLAPEMTQNPSAADGRADVYAIGVILNELLTGRSPAESFEAPSTVRPGLPVEVDQVIGRCMRPLPDERFESIQMLKLALMGALENVSEAPASGRVHAPAAASRSEDIDIDIDLDGDGDDDDVPAPAATSRPVGAPGLPPGLPPPRVVEDDPFAAGMGSGPGGGPPLIGSAGDAFDLESLITEAAGEDEDKYLISKRGLDFGPFAVTEIKRQIASGDIAPEDAVVDVDSGKRIKVKEHVLFKDFTLEVIRRKEALRRAEAESATETTEKRKSRLMLFVGIAAVAVIGLGVGSVFIIQGITKKKKGMTKRGGEGDDYVGSDEDPTGMKRRGGRRGRRRGGRSGGSGQGLDMEVVARDNFNFGGAHGGQERLSPSVIQSVIDRRKNRVGNCMLSAGAKSIRVYVHVRGNGRLGYVGASPKSAASCVRRALGGLRFPKFNGSVTKGSYYLSM